VEQAMPPFGAGYPQAGGGANVERAAELAQRRRLAMVLRSWRWGEAMLARMVLPELRRQYEQAVALAVLNLPADGSMASLVEHYCERGGDVDLCIKSASLSGDPRGGLQPAVIRNAAYWRKLQLLLRRPEPQA
jgi:hypothetical protein